MSGYAVRTALGGIMREKWINLLCTLTIATGLLLISGAVVLLYNVDLAARQLPERFSLTVFLADDVPDSRAREIVNRVGENDAVREALYISKEEAIEELGRLTGDAGDVLDGLDVNPLPPALEIHLRPGAVTEEAVESLTAELEGLEGVDEVLYGKKLLSVIQSVMRNTEVLGLALVGALTAGVVFVCYSTVKILIYRRKEEIETLKLLGATKGFIRAPFLTEGCFLGVAGGAAATLALLGLKAFVAMKLATQFPLLTAVAAPPSLLLAPPAAGLLIGLVGAFVAIGRIRY